MVKLGPRFTVKDAVEIGVLVVGLTLLIGRLEASTQTNAETLKALMEIQATQGDEIEKLKIENADRTGYERAIKEMSGHDPN